MKTLSTGVAITYKKNGNVKKCVSIYDNAVTNQPLPSKDWTIKVRNSYVPLVQSKINDWFNKHF